ncbi:MAG: hypothetical protein U1E73_08365 [Planctomycetota bacterium]
MRVIVLLLVVLLGAGVAFWALGGSDPGAPPGPAPAETPRKQAVDPGPPERTAVRSEETPPTNPANPAGRPDAAAAPDAPAAPSTQPNLALHVRSAGDQRDVASFQVTARTATSTVRARGEAGHAALAAPPGVELDVLVEAEGFQPWRGPMQGAAAATPPPTTEVFLTPAAVAAGIELHVHTLEGEPVPRLRVEAFALAAGADRGPWQHARPLWSRIADRADGVYALPELAPGSYGIRAMGVDAKGDLLPRLPFLRTYELTGSNGFVEDVPLEPGCAFGIELVDAAGNAVAPPPEEVFALELRQPPGAAVAHRWVQTVSGQRSVGVDLVSAAGPAWLEQAIAPGVYELTVRERDTVRVQMQIVLRGGERQLERVPVPGR